MRMTEPELHGCNSGEVSNSRREDGFHSSAGPVPSWHEADTLCGELQIRRIRVGEANPDSAQKFAAKLQIKTKECL